MSRRTFRARSLGSADVSTMIARSELPVLATRLAGLRLANTGNFAEGAVQFLPPEDEPTDYGDDIEVLDASALNDLVDGLDDNPLAITDESDLSLPGVQDKMLLIALGDGQWARPLHGRPSTHILKRDHLRHTGIVAAELDGLRLARHIGLTTIDASVER